MRELSARLTKLGRPILPSGITKIEQGKRRVDVDDLVALAVALKVTPTRLLLGPPPTDGPDDPAHKEAWEWVDWESPDGTKRYPIPLIRLAPDLALEPWEAWPWALGEDPLGEIWRLPEENSITFEEGDRERFRAENRLPILRPLFGGAEDVQMAVAGVRRAVQEALDQGLTEAQVEQVVSQAMGEWSQEGAIRKANQERIQRAQQASDNDRESS